MHQQPPKIPLLCSTSAAKACHVVSSRALTVYAGAVTGAVWQPAGSPQLRRPCSHRELGCQETGVTSTSTQRFSPLSLLSKLYGYTNVLVFDES